MQSELRPRSQIATQLSTHAVAGARLVMADLDGCLVAEGRPFPEAVEFVQACAERLWIVSNNSTHSSLTLSAELNQMGLPVASERVVLAGEQTLLHLARNHPDSQIALFASDDLQDQSARLGLKAGGQRPDHVVLCRDPSFAIPQMEQVIGYLQQGAQIWVANTDLSHPALDGRPVPETGALLAALQAAAGGFAYQCLGKPSAQMVRQVLDMADCGASDAVFVGDNPDTDGQMATDAGIPFIHIRREPT